VGSRASSPSSRPNTYLSVGDIHYWQWQHPEQVAASPTSRQSPKSRGHQ
jgi:hypothetical protein